MKLRERKESALGRLEAQLESGVKTEKGSSGVKIKLTEKDMKRISKEIEVLKVKLKVL